MPAKFVLCQYILGKTGQVEITEAEYKALGAALKTLFQLRDAEEKYTALIENYFELELSLLEVALRSMILQNIDAPSAQQPRNLINRRIINLLTAARLYVDSFPQHAGALLTGDVLANVLKAPSEAYDKSLAYRVMETLRNYSQHAALPVHMWATESRWDDSVEPSLLKFSVDPGLGLEMLALSPKFKKTVLDELKKYKEAIPLKPLIREYIEHLSGLHETFRKATEQVRVESKKLIEDAVARFITAFPDEEEFGMVALPLDEEGHQDGEAVYLTGPLLEYLKHLQTRTLPMVNYSRRRVEY